MNRARSLVDGTDWDAAEFGAKDLLRRARHRGKLHCLGCGQPAVFKTGTGVRAPLFRGNPQSELCVAERAVDRISVPATRRPSGMRNRISLHPSSEH